MSREILCCFICYVSNKSQSKAGFCALCTQAYRDSYSCAIWQVKHFDVKGKNILIITFALFFEPDSPGKIRKHIREVIASYSFYKEAGRLDDVFFLSKRYKQC